MGKSQIDPDQIKKVVVRGTNWVGDAVMTVPALRELRRILSSARIALFSPEWSRGIFADSDFIDDIITAEDGVFKQGSALRNEEFDLAVLFTNSFSSAAAARIAGAKYRVGYKNEGRGFLLTHALKIPEWREERHEVFYYLNIAAELEALLYGETKVWENEPSFELTVSEQRKTEARGILADAGCDVSGKIVAICPGSTNSRAKRWQAESYAILAEKLKSEMGANVVLIGAEDELDVSRSVAGLMKEAPVILTGKTSLAQAVAVLSVCDLLVSNDTGPAHISAALGTPTLAIFGPTNPKTTRPYAANAEIIRHEVECSPCMLRDCPIDHRCMTRISPDEVFAKAKVVLR